MAKNPHLVALSRRIDKIERHQTRSKQPNLGFSSIDGGALQANDDDNVLTMIIGQQFDGTNTAAAINGPTPPTPIAPLLTPIVGGLKVYWDGTFEDDALSPMDWTRTTVHAVPTSEFVEPEPLDQTRIVGSFSHDSGSELSAMLPYEEHVVYLVAWSEPGHHSDPGPTDVATPSKVDTADLSTELNTAITSANGKNAIQWSTDEPPSPPLTSSIEGDLWWQRGIDAGIATDDLVGMWRYDGTAWQPQQLGSETIAYLDAGVITTGSMTGIKVQTRSEDQRGVKMGYVDGQEGLFVYDDTGAVFLKAVPAEGMAVVAGEVKANSLTVSSDDPASPPGSSLGGVTEIATGGKILLTSGTTAPKSAPTATYGYDTVQFTNDSLWQNRRGWATDGTYWYTLRQGVGLSTSVYLERWNDSGTFDSILAELPGESVAAGLVILNSKIYGLTYDAGSYMVTCWTMAGVFNGDANWTSYDGVRIPAIGADLTSGEIILAWARSANANKVRVRRFVPGFSGGGLLNALTPAAWFDTDSGYDEDLAGVWHGNADFGSERYVISSETSNFSFRPINGSGVFQVPEYWPTGTNVDKVGFTHTGAAFVGMTRSGVMRIYTEIWSTVDAEMTKWVSNSLAQGPAPTYLTDQSPRAKIVMAKRSKLNVTTSPIPSGSDADSVRIYVGQGTTDPGRLLMAAQPALGVGVTTVSYSSLLPNMGTNPPATNNFPTAAGSTVENSSGVFFKDDGTVPEGPFRNGIGSFTTWTASWTAATTNPTGHTIDARYVKHGNLLDCHITITVGSGLGSGAYSLTLPFAPARGRRAFMGVIRDVSGFDDYEVILLCSSGTTIANLKVTPTTAGNMLRSMTSTVPMALAAGDTICFDFTYEIA